MKVTRILYALILLGLSLSAEHLEAQKKVLLIVREVSNDMEFMLNNEVSVMIDLMRKAGAEVFVATESGKPMHAGLAKLVPDLKLSMVQMADYDGIVIPCMQAGDFENNVPQDAIPIMKEAFAAGKPIAAQNALEMVAAAGLVAFGRPVASAPGVVVDGKLITSYNCPYMAKLNGKPVDTYNLIAKFMEMLNRL
jgi:putative intracellular protease/amidase